MEARQPAVEMIAPLVGAQAELLTAQAEAGAADPVGTPADGAPQTGVQGFIAHKVIVAQDHVNLLAGPIRHPQRSDRCAEGK